MNKEEFIKELDAIYGEYTAFVLDMPSNRYNYVGATIDDDLYENLPNDAEYNIDNIGFLKNVKEVMMVNLLSELEPASNVEDECYNDIKKRLENNDAKVGWWYEEECSNGLPTYSFTYILIL